MSLAIVAGSLVVLASITAALIRWDHSARRLRRERAAIQADHSAYLDQIGLRLALASAEWDREHPPFGVRCDECGRRLRSRQGHAQHRRACHE
jgi:hypothetical protein